MGESLNKRTVKIAKPKKRAYILNFGWCGPVFDAHNFYRFHVCHPLFNDYPQVINAGGMKCAFLLWSVGCNVQH
jgi:hypothetical protein